ncbi:Increased DNA methylation like [Actinidia chinensis var. chinensis]|uniref:Increased DNA methylation like n=1 Tax=Actinidia chinensis var. chinensis TaxID=1590841 RepID=A0A2R6Q3I3_ACTCC|nr:Increased DNA methylation like [Actinidia chinensis var. chinensis]
MHEMEEGVRSGEGLVKKKNSSGCLIIKKKGIVSSGPRKVYESNKERKRPRLVVSDSGTSGESTEPLRRKVDSRSDNFQNGSVGYGKNIVEEGKLGWNGESESERKRRLDVFEFDEYDVIDGKRMRKDYFQDRFKIKGRSGIEKEFETGSSRHGKIEKRKKPYFETTSNSSGGRKSIPDYTVQGRFEIEDDEAHLPISSFRHKFHVPSDEPIRVQGKNGVLKVMVNKKKKMDLPHKLYDQQLDARDRRGSKSENAIKKNVAVGASSYSDLKRPEKAISFVRTEKSALKLRRPVSKSAKGGDSETEDSDTSLGLGSASVKAKGVKSEGKAPSADKITPVRGKEVKIKRGSGTEKQLLREKIRHMLVTAGWTIDYRPRRNRDYLDAVYINPTGTAYWSIIKAYDALQKQLDEEDDDVKPSGDSSSFTLLPEELLSKLTRQTRKKMEKEMKMKRRGLGGGKNVKEAAREESAEDTDGDTDDEKLSFFKKQNGKPSKGKSYETTYVSGDDSSCNLYKGSLKQERSEKPSTASNSVIQGRKSRKIGRCTLLVRSSDKRLNSESDGYVPYKGKRTVLSWLIDSEIVQLSERVQYKNRRRTRVMLEGWITRDGIHCGCCSKILTVSKFEIHAGSKLRQPFQNIYLESGVSLLQCQIDAWNRQEESKRCGFHSVGTDGDDPDDDTCGLCGDGGDLICCDGCPSTFHQSCLNIQMLPPGDWHCPNCICKICGIAGEISAQGNPKTVRALLTCSLCEKKYHESCSQEMDPADLNRASTSFCGKKCRELFDHLQKLLGIKHELEAGFSWSLIHRTDLDTDASHRGFPQRVESNSKLAVALSVVDECFLPIVDRKSGINLIHNVLYNCGSNFSRLNYSGFYTAILERGDEIISAASIKIHGTQLAEMPFIGTRHIYRRQGMCRRLFCTIESVLSSLGVEKLVIPAIAEHMHTWTVVFGFNPLEELHKQEMRSMNMLVFPGTDMLHKLLVGQKMTEGNTSADSGAKSNLIKEDHHPTPELTKKIDVDSSGGNDLNVCGDASLHNADEIGDKPAAVDSGLQAPDVPSDDNPLLDSSLNVSSEPILEDLSEENTTLHSQLVKESVESSADMKCPPSSDLHHVPVEMENPVLDPSVKGNSSEGIVDYVHEENVKAAVTEHSTDALGETSTMDTVDEIKGDNPSNTELSPHSTVCMESKLDMPSESEAKVEPVEGNIQSSAEGQKDAARKANVEVSCAGAVLDSLGQISAATEKTKENQDPGSVSSHGIEECTAQLASDLNQSDALGVQNELNVASQVSNAEVASEARVAPVDDNLQSSAAGESDNIHETNVKFACVKPVVGSLGDISGQNTAEDIEANPKHVSLSSLHGTDESIMQCNSDLNHQSTFEVESELPVASEDSFEAEVSPVKNNIQPPAVGDMDSTHEINGEVACVAPDLDSFKEIYTQNKDINEDQDPAPVSTLNGSDESTVRFNSDWNRQSTLEVESNLCAGSEVASEENVSLAGNNILSSTEDDGGKDVQGVNVMNASVEPVLNNSGEISAENASLEIRENIESEVALVGSNIVDGGKDAQEVNVVNTSAEPVLNNSGEVSAENATLEVRENIETEVAQVGSNILSSAEDDGGKDTQAVNVIKASVEPALNNSGEISLENATLEIRENIESEVALVGSNILSSTEDDGGKDPQVVNVIKVSVEPIINSSGEVSAENATLEIRENIETEVTLVGTNILSSAEGDGCKDAQEINVINASVEPVRNNSDEIFEENTTLEIKENTAVSTFHGSDGSSVQFESDKIHNSATAMETEVPRDSEVPSDAMDSANQVIDATT